MNVILPVASRGDTSGAPAGAPAPDVAAPALSGPADASTAQAFWTGTGGGEIAAVCCFFNPCRYRSRIENYRRFRANIAQSGMPLLTVELAFGDAPFDLPLDPGGLRLRGGDIMWQKERLLRIGGEILVTAGYRKLAMLDADLLFEDLSWPEQVARALDRLPLVQCFDTAEHQRSDETVVKPAIAFAYRTAGAIKRVAPGLAWGMRAEVLRGAGMFEYCVVGGGDAAFSHAALGLPQRPDAWEALVRDRAYLREPGTTMQDCYRAWAITLYRETAGECGYVHGRIVSLPHGAKADRGYVLRHQLLSGFNPGEELTVDQCGAFAWTDAGGHRRDAVADYFSRRREDLAAGSVFASGGGRDDAN